MKSPQELLAAQAEESLKIIESSPSAMLMTDGDGIIRMLNRQAAEIFGYAKEELLGQPVEILVPDSVRPHHPQLREGYQAHPDVRSMGAGRDLFAKRKDGTEFPVEIGLNPIEMAEGTRILVGISDLTERKRTEKLLAAKAEEARRQEKESRNIIESSPSGMIMADGKGKITMLNERAAALFGYAKEELLGQPIEILVPDSVRGHHHELRGSYMEHPDVRAMGAGRDLFGRHKDGSQIPIEIGLNPIETSDGMHVLAGIIDLTARKSAEEELRVTAEAANAASKAKSDFLANMSHEIRTPMNGIIGMTELLLATTLNKDQRDYLNLVNQSADSLLNVINDILDFSKIEAGKLELDEYEFDLRDSIGDTLQTLGLRAAQKGLELAYQVQPDVPDCLVGDLGRLRQAMVNLIGNAVKFTENGEVVVDINLDSRTAETATLHFKVRDTGIGIPPEKQATIFDSFTQAEGSTTRKFGGTGLGLTISRQLVELMDGRMWLESEPGRGSTFHFTARLGIGSDKPHPSRAAPETLHGLPVLIIDDNSTNRMILQEMLNNWGMSPASAAGGREALEKLDAASRSDQPFRLILLDMMMPEMDGLEVAQAVRDRHGKKDPAILILSSAGHQTVPKAEAERLGVERVLMKPLKQSDLLDAITRTFGTAVRDEVAPGEVEKLPGDVRPMKLLLAEDGLVNQKVAIKLLEGRGHSVVLAEDGQAAVEAFERETFDAILMDVQMPRMDGYEATGVIRALEQVTGQHIPIIAMTANAMKGDREKCLESGMDDYVAKPVRSKELFAVVEKYGGGVVAAAAPAPDDESANPVQIFDAETFRENMGGDDFMRELISVFDAEAVAFIDRAKAALKAADAKGLHDAVHSLKGLVGNYCADPAHEAASRLDQLAQNGDLEQAVAALTQCESEVARLGEALREFARTLRD